MSELDRADLYDAFLGKHDESAKIAAFVEWLVTRRLGACRGELLDMGCGTGRMLEALAALGFRVTGREPDPPYYERAVERAAGIAGVTVERGGFLDLDAEARFDVCVAINGPLSYLQQVEERREALARVFRALRPGGVLLVDLANLLYLLRHGHRELPVQVVETGGCRVERRSTHAHDFDQALWIHHDELTLVDRSGHESVRRESFAFAMIPPPELRATLRALGYRELESYRSWSSREDEPLDGPRLMISARRPA